MTRNTSSLVGELKPIILMVLTQIASGGVNIFYKLATIDGMKVRILVPYRLFFATAFMIPLALIFERNRPKLTWMIAVQGFLCGIFGAAMGNNLYAESLVLTSATFATAMSNLTPALTFIMAIIFRLERLAIGTLAGKAKVLGTVLGIGGAMILTLYKGLEIKIWSIHINVLHHHHDVAASQQVSGSHVWGSLLALASCLSFAGWLIIQTKLSQRYPCYSSTALTCFMGSIQAAIYAMCTEKDWSAWKLGWNIRLITAAYSGIVSSGLMIAAMAWCSRIKGPLFVSSFYPISLIFVAFVGSLFLDDKLHLGCIIGSVLIIMGLYIVLWGKGKEKKMAESVNSKSSRGCVNETSLSGGNQAASAIVPIISSAQEGGTSSATVEEA